MPVIAKIHYLKIAPRKVRLVADLIRGKMVAEAQNILRFTVKRASRPLLKLLQSAIANAKYNFQLDESNLYISKITVDEGPKYKRWRARARGRAAAIQKKTAHITLCLDEITKKIKKVPKLRKVRPELIKKAEKIEKIPKKEKPKFKPELERPKPKIEKEIKRVFRRKAF